MRLFICWFRGHAWRYDRHLWGSGLTAHDQYVCETCGRRALESTTPAPAEAAA